MAKLAFLLTVAAVLAVQLAAGAVDHPVGGDGSWDASGTNYNAWASMQKIVQGDSISFKYTPSHDVVEVTKAGYDACSGGNPVKSHSGGNTIVKLTTPGKHYFICSVSGHCAAGMKVEVTITAAGTTAPTPTKSKPRHQRSVAPTPAPAAVPSSTEVSTPTTAPAPGSSTNAAASVGMLGAKAVMGLAALALAM